MTKILRIRNRHIEMEREPCCVWIRRILLAIGLLIISTTTQGCGRIFPSAGCNDSVIKEAPSPNKSFVVLVVERNCGATADYSTIVQLVAVKDGKKQKPNDVFVVKGQSPIQVEWLSDYSLRVNYSNPEREVFKKEQKFDIVTVDFQSTVADK